MTAPRVAARFHLAAGEQMCHLSPREAEGFRRITYFVDRPDVMALFTTRVTADAVLAPVLLSNGDCVESGEDRTRAAKKGAAARHYAVWRDPWAKPCYLFALVAGDLGAKRGTFVTASGAEVVARSRRGPYEHRTFDRYSQQQNNKARRSDAQPPRRFRRPSIS